MVVRTKLQVQMKGKILITGAAGFIGFHLTKKALEMDDQVMGLDNLNDYYDNQLKKDRISQIHSSHFTFIKGYLEDNQLVDSLFKKNKFDYVINLAAQAGVRYSLINPHAYIESNIEGFLNILEACRHYPVKHLIFASSSSVYGANERIPFAESDTTDKPLSLYGASKKSDELIAYSYSHLFNIPTTGLRFFTVYGPWGRPDMAAYIFAKAIFEGKPIKVFNFGKMRRDFTYIDDIVVGVLEILKRIPFSKESGKTPPFEIYNIGNNKPESLEHFIEVLEKEIGKKATKEFLPLQPGDVIETYAAIDKLTKATGFSPSTSIETGIRKFIEWYRTYHKV